MDTSFLHACECLDYKIIREILQENIIEKEVLVSGIQLCIYSLFFTNSYVNHEFYNSMIILLDYIDDLKYIYAKLSYYISNALDIYKTDIVIKEQKLEALNLVKKYIDDMPDIKDPGYD